MKALHDQSVGIRLDPDEPERGVFERGSFLTVTGVIDSKGVLSIEPGFKIDYRRRTQTARLDDQTMKEAMILEFLNKRKEILTQCVVPLAHLCAFGSGDLGIRFFAALVRIPADYQFLRYYVGERLVKEVAKPTDAPVVKFVRTPEQSAADNDVIDWEVIRHTDADVRSVVLYSHDDGQSWEAIVPPSATMSNSVAVRFADLPGGRVRLKALATDGFSTATVESAPFDVPIKGVHASILGPAGGAEMSADSPTWFHGQAYDYEKQDIAPDELLWCSSRDGELGRGAVIAARLSPGVHEVTLKCCKSKVSITIVAKPDRRTGPPPLECDK